MNELMSQADAPCLNWRKPSYSGGGNNCVELTVLTVASGSAAPSAT